ncbi:MAG: ParB N-terminal domain-containing protein [Lachnospiraceae bacterium]|nr:ParB N-terminal domain-containing protein [Lachnospiraceae bacterium]
MAIITKEFQENVLDEMKDYSILTHTEKAPLYERLLVKKVPTSSLHPNPDDEFTNPEIGPNSDIVGGYEKEMVSYDKYSKTPHIEPIIVEKLSTGGYMILNGHHRWLAAKKLEMPYVPIRIVTPTHEQDIQARLAKLSSDTCVSIDLDEVLICDPNKFAVDKLPFPLDKMYIWPIRKDSRPLINTLRRMGCDVWIYTGNYYPPQFIKAALTAHRIKVDGIISGLDLANLSNDLRKAIRKKYSTTIHIDGERLLWVNAETKEFESFDLPADDTWARKAASKIQEIITSDAYRTDE